MAEALGKKLAGDVFDSFSAGTEPGSRINPDAVRLMKQVYGIDMEQTQYNKPLSRLPDVDIVVTMGCNVQCPAMPCSHREDWGLDDPSGREDGVFLAVMAQIEEEGAGPEAPHPDRCAGIAADQSAVSPGDGQPLRPRPDLLRSPLLSQKIPPILCCLASRYRIGGFCFLRLPVYFASVSLA